MHSSSEHWNRIFRETADEKLGWYESDLAPTLRLLEQVPDWSASVIILPGAGTSGLMDHLQGEGAKLIANDISRESIDLAKARLGPSADAITWICGDIAQPLHDEAVPVDIWIDRAVLHFLTGEADIEGYFRNVMNCVKAGGHALFVEFAPHGETRCAGLEVHRYSVDELAQRLGGGFELVDSFEQVYTTPAGEPRPYIYALFKRSG